MLLFIRIRPFFGSFCFLNVIMYTLNIASPIKKMTVDELRDFISENCHKQTGFFKESSYYSMKRLEKRFFIAFSQINRKKS